MQYPREDYDLRVQMDTKNCDASEAEKDKIDGALEPLRRVIKNFPPPDLFIYVLRQPHSKDYHVKTSLLLSGKTLFTGERHEQMYTAIERCLHKLVGKVDAYKSMMSRLPEISKQEKGTHQDVLPSFDPDPQLLEQTIGAGDYAAFRTATLAYEEPIRKRIGRWIQRYPDLEGQLGIRLTIEDIVEDVFLGAFDGYNNRPGSVPLGDWIDSLIDPTMKALLSHLDEEMENISFARTLRESEPAQK